MITTTRSSDFAAAPCTKLDPELFFPDPRDAQWKMPAALKACAACPARNACLEYALTHDLLGIWGGTSQHERARIRDERTRARRARVAAAPIAGTEEPHGVQRADALRLQRVCPHLSIREIGELLGISQDAARGHLERASPPRPAP